MKCVLLFCLTIFLAWNFSLAYKAEISQHKGFLGRIGYKAYLVERINGNWTQGKSYCEGLGMTLAKIETTDELNFLNSKYQSGVFSGWHWTAARDSHRPEQFVWDDNNSTAYVALPWIEFEKLKTEYLSCAAFNIWTTNVSDMLVINCDSSAGHVLCEI